MVLSIDFTARGSAHLFLGAFGVAAGVAVLLGQVWARVIDIDTTTRWIDLLISAHTAGHRTTPDDGTTPAG